MAGIDQLTEEQSEKEEKRLDHLLRVCERQQIVQNMFYTQESVMDASLRKTQEKKQ